MNYVSQSCKEAQLAKRVYNWRINLDWGFKENVCELVIFMLNSTYRRTLKI